jgi:hypothetical protein
LNPQTPSTVTDLDKEAYAAAIVEEQRPGANPQKSASERGEEDLIEILTDGNIGMIRKIRR